MQLRKLTMLFAAVLLLGMTQPAKAEEAPTSVLDTIADYEDQLEDAIAASLDDDADIDDDDDDDLDVDRRRGPREFRDRYDRRHYGRRGPGYMHGRHFGFQDRRMGRMGGMGGFGFNRPGMNHASFMFGPRTWEALKLTADQKTKVIDIMTNNYRAKLEASLEMIEAQRAVRGMYRDDSLQAEAIIAAHSEMGAARGKMMALDRQLKNDLKAVLTPDQQKAWDELKKPRAPRKPGPDGKGPGGDRRPQRGPDGPAPRR